MRHIITKFPPKTLIKRLLTTTTTATTTKSQPVPGKLDRIAAELLSLNAVELHDYSILFSLKMGLKTAGPASISSGSGPLAQAGEPAAAAVKTVFDLKLEKFDAASKIKIIKEVRSFTELGLKEAKELVEKAPSVIKTGVSKEEGEAILEKLKQLGATVVLE